MRDLKKEIERYKVAASPLTKVKLSLSKEEMDQVAELNRRNPFDE